MSLIRLKRRDNRIQTFPITRGEKPITVASSGLSEMSIITLPRRLPFHVEYNNLVEVKYLHGKPQTSCSFSQSNSCLMETELKDKAFRQSGGTGIVKYVFRSYFVECKSSKPKKLVPSYQA